MEIGLLEKKGVEKELGKQVKSRSLPKKGARFIFGEKGRKQHERKPGQTKSKKRKKKGLLIRAEKKGSVPIKKVA